MVTFEHATECERSELAGEILGPNGNLILVGGTRCTLDGYRIHTLVLTSMRDGVELQVDEADAKTVSDEMRLRKCLLVKNANTLSAVLIEDLHRSDN